MTFDFEARRDFWYGVLFCEVDGSKGSRACWMAAIFRSCAVAAMLCCSRAATIASRRLFIAACRSGTVSACFGGGGFLACATALRITPLNNNDIFLFFSSSLIQFLASVRVRSFACRSSPSRYSRTPVMMVHLRMAQRDFGKCSDNRVNVGPSTYSTCK